MPVAPSSNLLIDKQSSNESIMKNTLLSLFYVLTVISAQAQLSVRLDTLYVSDIAYEELPGFLYASFECPGPHAEFSVTLTNTQKKELTISYHECSFGYRFNYDGSVYEDTLFHPNYNFGIDPTPFTKITLAPGESFSAFFPNDCFNAYLLRDNKWDLTEEMAKICPTVQFFIILPDKTKILSDQYQNIDIQGTTYDEEFVKNHFDEKRFKKLLGK